MFDLENEIAAWREVMRSAGIGPGPVRNELESNLRDEFELAGEGGMSPDASFAAAMAKLGAPRKLKQEFDVAMAGTFASLGRRSVPILPTNLRRCEGVRSALAYPALMICVAAGVIVFFLLFFLPKLQSLLSSLGDKMPISTQILVAVAHFALHYGLFVAVALAVGAVFFLRWRVTEIGRKTTDSWVLNVPLLGAFSVAQSVLAFSQTLSVLLENGITAAEALRMTERQISNRVHRDAFNTTTALVLEGEALSSALQRTGCFPGLVLDHLAVGENTGNVVPSLKDIARDYQKIVSNQLNFFTRVIASLVLVGVFVFIGFIAFAIVSAVFQLSASFKA